MKTIKKIKLYGQVFFLFYFFLSIQGCQAQDKKLEKDIETIQKAAISEPVKVSYTGNVDFKMAAKIATPGVVNIKCTLKRERHGNEESGDFYDLPESFKDFFKEDPFFRQFKMQPNYNSEPIIGSASFTT